MKPSTAERALGVALLVLSAFLVVGVLTFAGPCIHDDGSPANCAMAAQGIVGAGVMLVGVSLGQILVSNARGRGVLAVLAVCLGLFVALAPGNLLPLCMMPAMHCRAVMQPFAMACGGIIALLGAAAAIVSFRSGLQ